jgi:hypothetical protein
MWLKHSENLKSKTKKACRKEMVGYLFECIYSLPVPPVRRFSHPPMLAEPSAAKIS